MKSIRTMTLSVAFTLAAVVFGALTVASADDSVFKLEGVIQALPSGSGFVGDWRVAGRTVHVNAATKIEQELGSVAVGARVEIKGSQESDGSVTAWKIEVTTGAAGEGELKFMGTIQSLPSAAGFVGDWRVGGRTIHVTTSTQIQTQDGPVAVGAFVEIEGTARPDGSMDARKIEVKSNVSGDDGRDELKGTVESLPSTATLIGDWRVSGRTVHVTAATIVEQEHGAVAVGAQVEVKGQVRADGSIDATRVEVKISFDRGGEAGGLKGTIESIPQSTIGNWIISGVTVRVTSATRIKQEHGPIGVGVAVKVKGMRMSDGSITASKIQVRDSQ